MRRFNPSFAALAVSCVALFAALGGTSVAASLLIGTHQLKDGAVTSSKIGHHQVKTGNIANNAVTSAKVADGSLTAADVAPNTFLGANGTANNSTKLGGRPSTDYMLGRGGMFFNRITVPAGQSRLLLSFGFGDLIGKCAAGGVPQVEYQSDVSSVNLVDWVTDYGYPNGTASIHTTNGLSRGGTYIESHTSVVPQAINWQAAYDDGTPHVATAWTSGQDIGLSSCIFIGQAMSSN
ncbi:MAG TPA: hypothetical protein VNR66_05035 [Solirubrobacteraceae bacterium]|nr:hypothetical protein [Solirubrobacteraceae bacterium]